MSALERKAGGALNEVNPQPNSSNCQSSSASPCLKSCMTESHLSSSLLSRERRSKHQHTAPERSVSFGNIQIRSYERTVGVNPSVSSGPALDFSWKFSTHDDITLDHFEMCRKRRSKCELVVRRRDRENILRHDFDIPNKHIASAVRRINRTKARRRQTLDNLKFGVIEEFFEKAKRRSLRFIGLKKTTKSQIDRLWKDAPKAMAKLKKSNASEDMMPFSLSFSSSIFDDSLKRIRARRSKTAKKKKENKKATKKEPGVDECRHIMRYNLSLEGTVGKGDGSSTHVRLPTPTTSNVEPSSSVTGLRDNIQSLHLQQDKIVEGGKPLSSSMCDGDTRTFDSKNIPFKDDFCAKSDHPDQVEKQIPADERFALDQTYFTTSTVVSEDMDSLSISSKGIDIKSSPSHSGLKSVRIKPPLASTSKGLRIVAIEDECSSSNN